MKIRLTMTSRETLHSLARQLVMCKAEEAVIATAYEKAAPLVFGAVIKKFPQKDMRVLKKYNKAKIDDCIKLQLSAGGVDTFDFKAGKGPLVASLTYQGQIYAAPDNVTDAFLAWRAAVDAHKKARDAKLKDYDALITASRTLEDVEVVWPEASKLRSSLQSKALAVVTPELVERIRSDVATRKRSR